ncbi:MAG: hypothetical protein ACLQIQ_16095 [Beijerinckiaceae bacterium]
MNEHITKLEALSPLPPRNFFARWLVFHPQRRGRDFSGFQVAGLFALIMLIAAIPIITNPVPPLEDYINHLARMHVIAKIGQDSNLARFYEIDWEIVPNLIMDLVVPVLARVMNIYVAGQAFMIFIFMLIISGGLVVNRALFGRWSILPLVATPFLYNYVFLVGVVNYQFGIGLALWGLAAWIALRRRALPWRLLVSTGFVLLLFVCHLFAVGVYGIGILAYELWRLLSDRERPLCHRALALMAGGLPFLPIVPLLLLSSTWANAGEFEWESGGKIEGLFYIIQVYSDVIALTLAAILTVGVIWAVRRRLLHVHPLLFTLIGVGGLVYIALPRILFSTYLADQRLPVALAFMLVACLQIELRQRLVRHGFLMLLMIFLVIRVIEVDVVWAQLSPQTLAMRASVKKIAPGSTVLVAYADPNGGDDVHDLGIVHAACLAIIERAALVTTAFTVQGKQIMHVTPSYRGQVDTDDDTPPSAAQLVLAALHKDRGGGHYWSNWPQRFDYVYILFTEDDPVNPAPDFLTPVYDGDRFQLYKVRKPQQASGLR